MSIATWVGYPASYTAGRARAIQGVCVHYTAGSEGPTSAENGASYDKRRTDGTSTHVFADSNSVACEVPDRDRSHSALYRGNEVFLHLELCGTAQTRAAWLDPVSLATLRNGAKWAAEKCKAYGIPVRRLSVAETRQAYYGAPGARPLGLVGHVDITNAYPEDNGDHTDPGSAFPWDVFLAMVSAELATLNGGSDMAIDETTFNALAWRMDAEMSGSEKVRGGPRLGEVMSSVVERHRIEAKLDALNTRLDGLVASGALVPRTLTLTANVTPTP